MSNSKPAPSSVAGTGKPTAPSTPTTASAIVAEVVAGSHVLKIKGYPLIKGLIGNGEYIKSEPFAVGGHRWYLRYYPNGCRSCNADWVSIYLLSDDGGGGGGKVKAGYNVTLLDHDGKPVQAYTTGPRVTFSGEPDGAFSLVRKKDLEGSVYLRDDAFSVRCDLSVGSLRIFTESADIPSFAAVPTSDVHRHLGQLLSGGEGTDVEFEVAGERFGAHRCILAARSSVFMAELFGPIKKEKMDSTCVQIYDVEAKVFKAELLGPVKKEKRYSSCIRIDDVEAKVFKVMLHFIYTDSLPEIMEDETDAAAMAQHLLVVADRYNLERLRLICEDDLRRRIDASTAATMLALAEQHGCRGLKDACLGFLASPGNLKAVMGSDGFRHLSKSCPDILKELAAKIH